MSTSIILLSSIVEYRESLSDVADVVRFDPAGEPHARALVDAVVRHYHRLTGRPRVTLQALGALADSRISIAYTTRGMFGAPFIEARECTLMPSPIPTSAASTTRADGLASGNQEPVATRLALRPAGARSRMIALDAGDVLDVEPGYGTIDLLRERVELSRAGLPRLEALAQEDLLALPDYNLELGDQSADDGHDDRDDEEEPPTMIRLAVMGTCRLPHVTSPAAIWLLHSYSPDDDIAEGYLLINPSDGCSEHGSIYGRDILRFGGRIVLPDDLAQTPLTLTDAFVLGDLPQEQWLARFITREGVTR
jgi:hypothetical protein